MKSNIIQLQPEQTPIIRFSDRSEDQTFFGPLVHDVRKTGARTVFWAGIGAFLVSVALAQEVSLPDDPVVCNDTGVEFAQQGDMASAAKCFAKARELSPGDPLYAKNLAIAYSETGDLPNAVSQYRDVLKLVPCDVKTMEWLASDYERMGDLERASQVRKSIADIQEGKAVDARCTAIALVGGIGFAVLLVAGFLARPLIVRRIMAMEAAKRDHLLLEEGKHAVEGGPVAFREFVDRNEVSPSEVMALLSQFNITARKTAGLIQQCGNHFVGSCMKDLSTDEIADILVWLPPEIHSVAMEHLFTSQKERVRVRLNAGLGVERGITATQRPGALHSTREPMALTA